MEGAAKQTCLDTQGALPREGSALPTLPVLLAFLAISPSEEAGAASTRDFAEAFYPRIVAGRACECTGIIGASSSAQGGKLGEHIASPRSSA